MINSVFPLWTAFERGDLVSFFTTLFDHYRLLDDVLVGYCEQSYALLHPLEQPPVVLPKRVRTSQYDRPLSINWLDPNGYSLLHHIAQDHRPDAPSFAYALLSCPNLDIHIKASPLQLTALHIALGCSNLGVAHAIFIREARQLSDSAVQGSALAEATSYQGITPFETLPFNNSLFCKDYPADRGECAFFPSEHSMADDPDDYTGSSIFKNLLSTRSLHAGRSIGTFAFYPYLYSFDRYSEFKRTNVIFDKGPETQGLAVFGIGSNKNFCLGFGDTNLRRKPQTVPMVRTYRAFQRQHRYLPLPPLELITSLSLPQTPSYKCPQCIFFATKCMHPDRMAGRVHMDITNNSSDSSDNSDLDDEAVHDLRPSEPKLPFSLSSHQWEISDVRISNFHSAIITHDDCANLYLCGHGQGGRLGFGDEQTWPKFTCLDSGPFARLKVISIALGVDHTIALTDTGEVYSWGSNKFGQIGHRMARDTGNHPVQLTPKKLHIPKHKNSLFISIATSSLHSVVVTSGGNIFAFGKNEGQLGMSREISKPLQLTPHMIDTSMLPITPELRVSASDICTVVLIDSCDIWLFTNYTIHHVALVPSINHIDWQDPCHRDERCELNVSQRTVCFKPKSGSVYSFRIPTLQNGKIPPKSMRAYCIHSPYTSGQKASSISVGENECILLTTQSGLLWRLNRMNGDSLPSMKSVIESGADLRSLTPFSSYHPPVLVPTSEPVVVARSNQLGSILGIYRREQFHLYDMTSYNDSHSLNLGLDIPISPNISTNIDSGKFGTLMTRQISPRSWAGLSFHADIWTLFPVVALRDIYQVPCKYPYPPPPQYSTVNKYKAYVSERACIIYWVLNKMTTDWAILDSSDNMILDPSDGMRFRDCHLSSSARSLILLYSSDSSTPLPIHRFLLLGRFPSLIKVISDVELRQEPFNDDRIIVTKSAKTIKSSHYSNINISVTFKTLRIRELFLLMIFIYTDVSGHKILTEGLDSIPYPTTVYNPMIQVDKVVSALQGPYDPDSLHPGLPVSIYSLLAHSSLDLSSDVLPTPSHYEDEFFADADVLVAVSNGLDHLRIHSSILISRCAALGPLFSSSERGWTPSVPKTPMLNKFGNSMRLLDMKHTSRLAFYFVRLHLYSGVTGPTLFRDVTAPTQEVFVDLVLDVALLADELLLDPLSHGCQRILLRLTTAKNMAFMFNTLEHCVVETYRKGAVLYALRRSHSVFRYGDPLELIPLFDFARRTLPHTQNKNTGAPWSSQKSVLLETSPKMLAQRPSTRGALNALTVPAISAKEQVKGEKEQPDPTDLSNVVPASPLQQHDSSISDIISEVELQTKSDGLATGSGNPAYLSGSRLTLESSFSSQPPEKNTANDSKNIQSKLKAESSSSQQGINSMSNFESSSPPTTRASAPTPNSTRKETNLQFVPKSVLLDMRSTNLTPSPASPPLTLNDYIKSTKRRRPGQKSTLASDSGSLSENIRTPPLDTLQKSSEGSSLWSAVSSLEPLKQFIKTVSPPTVSEIQKVLSSTTIYPDTPTQDKEPGRTQPNPLVNTKLGDPIKDKAFSSKPSIFSVQHQPPARSSLYFSATIDPTVQSLSSQSPQQDQGTSSTRKSRKAANVKLPTPVIQDILTEQKFDQWWAEEEKRLQAVADDDDASLAMAIALAEGVDLPHPEHSSGSRPASTKNGKRRRNGQGGGFPSPDSKPEPKRTSPGQGGSKGKKRLERPQQPSSSNTPSSRNGSSTDSVTKNERRKDPHTYQHHPTVDK